MSIRSNVLFVAVTIVASVAAATFAATPASAAASANVKDWNTKYKNQGLVVVGVHTPEFAYEKSTRNVQDAIKRLQIKHAVAQDNSYGTWKAFNNQYWPAIYLIDKP